MVKGHCGADVYKGEVWVVRVKDGSVHYFKNVPGGPLRHGWRRCGEDYIPAGRGNMTPAYRIFCHSCAVKAGLIW